MTEPAAAQNRRNDIAAMPLRLPRYLSDWVGAQRWFSSTNRSPHLQNVGTWELPTTLPALGITVIFVRDADDTGADRKTFQVPLTYRSEAVPGMANALIATTEEGDGGTRYIYDAPHDPAFAGALLRFILEREAYPNVVDTAAHTLARGVIVPSRASFPTAPTVASSRVLQSEQSNTSIVFDLRDDNDRPLRPVICKIFRTLHAGANPDVTVQSALARTGSRCIPEPVGCIEGEWSDSQEQSGRATGHLVFAQEFLHGAQDGWQEALLSAQTGGDFGPAARRLGETTAVLHTDLARVEPPQLPTPRTMAQIVSGLLDRFREAAREVPELAELRDDVESIYARALATPWPPLQRVHGDFHLGQVLDAPGRGWMVLDFEGEPLRALHERTLPDVPLRDVAGMLRSFDYAAATVNQAHREVNPAVAGEWADRCRRAFLDGYERRSGLRVSDDDPLLVAFELDKAVYETVYETRHRPDWLALPLRAVRRIISADSRSRNDRD